MRRARATGLALVLLGLGPAPGCAEDEPVRGQDADFDVRLTLAEAETDARVFARGQPVTLVLAVRNTGEVERTLELPSAQTCEFAVSTAKGESLWRWSHGRMFAQVLTSLRFEPGETKTYRASWDQKDAQGRMAPPGDYRAEAWVVGQPPGTVATPVGFTIE